MEYTMYECIRVHTLKLLLKDEKLTKNLDVKKSNKMCKVI